MVANLQTTVMKFMAIRRALGRAQGGTGFRGFVGAYALLGKNAPAYGSIMYNYERAINLFGDDITSHQLAHDYFGLHPEMRQYVTEAYNKLPILHNQLNKIAHKIVTVRKMQRIRRSSVQQRNKREKNAKMITAIRAVKSLPRNMANKEIMRNVYANLHKSKTPYGPLTEMNEIKRMLRSYPKYFTY